MWGVFVVILVLGLIESLYAQPTSTGKTQASVFFGVFIAVCALLWGRRNRRRPHLQVTGQEIRYWDGGGNLSFVLARGVHDGALGQGEPRVAGPPAVCLLPARRGGGYFTGRRLTIPGSGDYLNVHPFRARQVRQACESRGWRFSDDPALIAHEAGRLAEVLRQSRQQDSRPGAADLDAIPAAAAAVAGLAPCANLIGHQLRVKLACRSMPGQDSNPSTTRPLDRVLDLVAGRDPDAAQVLSEQRGRVGPRDYAGLRAAWGGSYALSALTRLGHYR